MQSILSRSVAFAGVLGGSLYAFAPLNNKIICEGINGLNQFVTESATGASLPKKISLQSTADQSKSVLNLLGCGVRQITIFKFNTYVMGFYAQNIKSINLTAALRLVPTRSTNGTHLRNAFTKMLSDKLLKDQNRFSDNQVNQIKECIQQLCNGAFVSSKQIPTTAHITILLKKPNQDANSHITVYYGINENSLSDKSQVIAEIQPSEASEWVAKSLIEAYVGPNPLIMGLKEQVDSSETNKP